MKKTLFAALAASAILLPSAAFAEKTDTKADIQKVADEWMADYNKKDVDGMAAMYSPNAVFSTAFWNAAGLDAIKASLKAEVATGGHMDTITVERSMRDGNINTATGSWSATAKTPDGKPMPMNGHWMVVSEYKDGKYVIFAHTSNTNMAPAKK